MPLALRLTRVTARRGLVWISALLPLLMGGPVAWAQEVPPVIKACGSDFPPFTYAIAASDGQTGEAGGFSVALLKAALAPRVLQVSIVPWTRCLADAAVGVYDMALDSYVLPERELSFMHSKPVYRFTLGIAMRKDGTPAPARIEDLEGRLQCNVAGWYVRPAAVPPAPPGSSKAITVENGLAMVRAGRCDFLPLGLELVWAARENPQWRRQEDGIVFWPIPWHPSEALHALVRRSAPYGAALRDLIDQGLDREQARGETARLRKQHLPWPEP